ncbi:hypothetical protein H7J50_20040 [Mycobacterium intermedium]|uniref:hypothetical protein n=1 Tax=Mycobacterium intermedium TaxID=28445 RepID=UPI00111C0F13|nr:hypothetical protein [Mycobacterium intermedium]MCV6966081.1 hypothetical protein [Mycobacterium intermedium]
MEFPQYPCQLLAPQFAHAPLGRGAVRFTSAVRPDIYRIGMGKNDLGIEDYVNRNFPKELSVPTPDEASEEEAIRAVQKQFKDAGFDCSAKTARDLVRRAWKQAQ